MGKSSQQKQSEAADLQIQQQQIQLQQANAALARQYANIQQQGFQAIQPLAQGAIGIGNQALKGQAPAAFSVAPLANLQASTQQNQQNLLDFFGQSGQIAGSGANSGILAGPMASILNNQANQAANINQNAILQGLNTGFQGAGLLSGQQQIFNPFGASGAASNAGQVGTQDPRQYQSPWAGIVGGLAGGALSAAGSAFSGAGTKAIFGG